MFYNDKKQNQAYSDNLTMIVNEKITYERYFFKTFIYRYTISGDTLSLDQNVQKHIVSRHMKYPPIRCDVDKVSLFGTSLHIAICFNHDIIL
jgi:hypothetical protein